jgi:hypothetical protein
MEIIRILTVESLLGCILLILIARNVGQRMNGMLKATIPQALQECDRVVKNRKNIIFARN